MEVIGRGEHQRLLLWEAAEGRIGVWDQIITNWASLAEIAREALSVCQFDPATGTEDPDWNDERVAACYGCLLNFRN